MSRQVNSADMEWGDTWDAREAALTGVLGEPDGVLHSPIPFPFGGSADVLPFRGFVPGVTYATAEMTGQHVGQRPSSIGNYELMICVREELKKAADLISNLACYTCDAVLEPGETMDLGAFFGDSTIRALVFTHPGDRPVSFEFFGRRYGLLLCVGITAEELSFRKASGSERLVSLLKQHTVFPYTIPDRESVLRPRDGIVPGRPFEG